MPWRSLELRWPKGSPRCRPRSWPAASLMCGCVVDHRERLVHARVALNNTLQWHLHDLWPELRLPGSSLFYATWSNRIARRLARAEQSILVRIARDELRRLRELTHTINSLEHDIADLVTQIAPQLLDDRASGRSPQPSSSARSPAPNASQATPSSRAPPVWHRSRSAQATAIADALIAAATARSTPRSTASPSHAHAATPKPAPTCNANEPKARPPAKPSAASNATSPDASGTSSSRASNQRISPSLDIGAAKAVAALAGFSGMIAIYAANSGRDAAVAGQDDRAVLVAARDDLEEVRGGFAGHRQVAELVDHPVASP